MSVDKCVSCGESIPEGRQVCPMCEQLAVEKLNELDLMRERYSEKENGNEQTDAMVSNPSRAETPARGLGDRRQLPLPGAVQ